MTDQSADIRYQLLKVVLRRAHAPSAIIPVPPTAPSKARSRLPISRAPRTKNIVRKAVTPISRDSNDLRFFPCSSLILGNQDEYRSNLLPGSVADQLLATEEDRSVCDIEGCLKPREEETVEGIMCETHAQGLPSIDEEDARYNTETAQSEEADRDV